jgi:hypothetical protein
MQYDPSDCAHCYVSRRYISSLDDLTDKRDICRSCIYRLIDLSDKCKINKYELTDALIKDKSLGNAVCFLCNNISTWGYILSICEEHGGIFDNDADDSDGDDSGWEKMSIFVLLDKGKVIAAFKSQADAEYRKDSMASNNISIVRTILK